jgi:hypothetical protein
MTQDEIIEMAEQAGVAFSSDDYPDIWGVHMHVGKQEIEAFAKLVAAKEREACAKVCDSFCQSWLEGAEECADAIRARSREQA